MSQLRESFVTVLGGLVCTDLFLLGATTRGEDPKTSWTHLILEICWMMMENIGPHGSCEL